MTELDTPDRDLAARLRTLAEQVEPPAADVGRVAAGADRRRRRRRVVAATAGVALVAAAVAGAITVGGASDPTDRATGAPSTTEPPSSEAPSTETPSSETTGTTPPATNPSTSTSAPPTTSAPATSTPAAVDPVYMVSEGDTVVWYLPGGPVSVTPLPGVIVRAEAIGDGTAVAVSRGPDVRVFRIAPGEVLGEVPLPSDGLTDLWAAGLAGGRPVLVSNPLGSPGRLVAIDLDSGEERVLMTTSADESVFTPSLTADGRVLGVSGPFPSCRNVLIDVATGDEEPTGLDTCGFERAVSPDGTTVVDVSEDFAEVVQYDVATGEEVARVPASRPVSGEGFQIELDGTRVLLSNAYDDELHAPWEVVDLTTGAITPLPAAGPASFWVDPEG